MTTFKIADLVTKTEYAVTPGQYSIGEGSMTIHEPSIAVGLGIGINLYDPSREELIEVATALLTIAVTR